MSRWVLEEILKATRERIERAKKDFPLQELKERLKTAPPVQSFSRAFIASEGIALIGEIKKASPSAGLIREDFYPEVLAQIYEKNGAVALSVLTEEKFFQGKLDFIQQIKNKVSLPILRKDFIIDPYQIWESRFFGADAILLIVAILNKEQINEFFYSAQELGLEVLLEIHSQKDWRKIFSLPGKLIGINNRNLKTQEIDLKITFRLVPLIPKNWLIISESGIKTREDVLNLEKAGVKGILVGEAIMGSQDVSLKIRELLGKWPG